MKKLVILFTLFVHSMFIFSQTSGGQIKRSTKSSSTSITNRAIVPSKKMNILPKAVDLGLPSGTLWADRNLGANTPEGYGSYYAWGETQSKSAYTESNYKLWQKEKYRINYEDMNENRKYELDINDDAALAIWGRKWRIPTNEQFKELTDSRYTKMEWVEYHSVKGLRISSLSNNNFIFLPASGLMLNESPLNDSEWGHYWSRSLNDNDSNMAYSLSVNQFLTEQNTISERTSVGRRYYGLSIRPVSVHN